MPAPNSQEIIDFWFVQHGSQDWFSESEAFDTVIRQRFLALYEKLAEAVTDDQLQTTESTLAAILVLDQFPRNLFRGQPRAFATDHSARNIARNVLARGFDHDLTLHQRVFVYLPFEHSEDLADQDLSCSLFAALDDDNYLDYARRHREVIRRFGRFPHRNAILGRESTVQELHYLAQPGSGF